MTLTRIAKRKTYTIGRLEIDGTYVCDTLEPEWRNLKRKHKVKGRTAIPEGRYPVVITWSPQVRPVAAPAAPRAPVRGHPHPCGQHAR